MIARDDLFLGPIGHARAVALATAGAYLKRVSMYVIQLVRWPLAPVFTFVTWWATYHVAGRAHVNGQIVSGFLLIGIIGSITWGSSVWISGYAIEWERDEGTSAALFLSPASRAAVVLGYGLGSFVWFLPSFVVIIALGALMGARLHVTDGLALTLSILALFVSSLAAGFLLSGLFILSRRGNLIANVGQTPILLLAGFTVPRSALPGWLHAISNAIPAAHAVDALRASALLGADLTHIGSVLALAFLTSALCFVLGLAGLRRVETVAKRHGQLDLY